MCKLKIYIEEKLVDEKDLIDLKACKEYYYNNYKNINNSSAVVFENIKQSCNIWEL